MKFKRESNNLKMLAEKIEEMQDRKVEAGWFSSSKYDDGTPVAGIMYQNEFGNAGRSIPPRTFFRPAVSDNKRKWSSTFKRGFHSVIQGKRTIDQVLNIVGLQVVGDVKNSIENGDFAPLSKITIALRKHRDEGQKIGGAFVGSVAAAIQEGKTGRGELGDQSYGNITPLQDSGYAISTLNYEVS